MNQKKAKALRKAVRVHCLVQGMSLETEYVTREQNRGKTIEVARACFRGQYLAAKRSGVRST